MVKEGYKETEIGVIPEDWDVKPLKDCVSFLDHRRIPIKDSERQKMRGIYPYYGASGIIDYVDKYIFDGTYILLGEDGANIIDRSSRLAFVISGKCWINNHAHVLAPNSDYDVCFLSEYLESIKYDEYNTGTAQPKLNREKCSSIPIPVPSLEEQEKIAEALSDMDNLISSLEKLIEKKKDIKQGAMQELLTGKKRLPGFSGEWEKVALKEIISDFIVPMRDKPKNLNGPIPWCRIEDFDGKYLNSSKTNQGVTCDTINAMNLKVFPKETLLVSCSAYLGRCAIVKSELVTNQTFIGLVPSSKIDVEFLFYIMGSEEKNLNLLSSGTTISYLSREQFEEYKICIPIDVSEQNAIASILSDMDEEITVLEQKLAKCQKLKQGMMQQLLTGKIRFI